ncbi:MAG: IS1380 family transposase [Candidatus Dormibacteraceae bacterium]
MKNTISNEYRKLVVTGDGQGVVNHAGAVALSHLADTLGLTQSLSMGTRFMRRRRAGHDRGVVLRDLAVSIANGGDSVSDMGSLRDNPKVHGELASGATVMRVVRAMAEMPKGLELLGQVRAKAREQAWRMGAAPKGGIILDIDATLVNSHSEKEGAAGNYKHGYGFHPLVCFMQPTGEALAGILRGGNAGSNTASDHIEVLRQAIEQLPMEAAGGQILVRTDSAGATHEFLNTLRCNKIRYSVGFDLTEQVIRAIQRVREQDWVPAIGRDGEQRELTEAAVVELDMDLGSWPKGSRVICRREVPHPGAQLRLFEDWNGYRYQLILSDQWDADIASLELRHRQRARCEDCIRCAKDTGLRKFPFQAFRENQIWLELVLMAHDLLTFFRPLCLSGKACRWEPKTLRHRLFHTAARISHSGRQLIMRIQADWKWKKTLLLAFHRLGRLQPG